MLHVETESVPVALREMVPEDTVTVVRVVLPEPAKIETEPPLLQVTLVAM
jgi:hypothetical protein